MISIPAVELTHYRIWWNPNSQIKWFHSSMGLSQADCVQSLEVNNAPGISIVFGNDVHPGAKCLGGVLWHFLNHSQSNITVNVVFNTFFPSSRDIRRSVYRRRFDTCLIDQDPHWCAFKYW